MAQDEPTPQTALGIDLGTELSLQSDRLVHRLKGVFIGMDRDECIIVRVSPEQFRGILPHYLWRSPVICRYVHEGRVFGFQSNFLDAISFPISALFLSYPERVECVDLRQHPRTECFVPSLLSKRESQERFETFILDISEGGCRCSIHSQATQAFDAFEPGDQVELHTSLGTQGRRSFRAVVRNLCLTEIQELLVGLQFEELAGEDRAFVVQFILNTNSELRAQSFQQFQEWQGHKLPRDLAALFIDSYAAEISDGSSSRPVSLQVVVGLDFEARKDLIEMRVTPGPPDAQVWGKVLDDLRQRGLNRCLFAVSGEQPGLAEALSATFPDSDLQLCFRSLLTRVHKQTHPKDGFQEELEKIGQAKDFRQGLDRWGDLLEKFRERYATLCAELEEKPFQYLVFLNLPIEIRHEFSGLASIESLFSILDGFRLSSGGSFASGDDLLIKAFWANWRLHANWQEPIQSLASNLGVLEERFEQIFLDRPNRTPFMRRTAGFQELDGTG
ncbi:MAG: transposase [Acidobacteriota bacterium]